MINLVFRSCSLGQIFRAAVSLMTILFGGSKSVNILSVAKLIAKRQHVLCCVNSRIFKAVLTLGGVWRFVWKTWVNRMLIFHMAPVGWSRFFSPNFSYLQVLSRCSMFTEKLLMIGMELWSSWDTPSQVVSTMMRSNMTTKPTAIKTHQCWSICCTAARMLSDTPHSTVN